MNYAEDRLDRRARTAQHPSSSEGQNNAALTDVPMEPPRKEEYAKDTFEISTTTQGQLACDLQQAHHVFHTHNRRLAEADDGDTLSAHKLLRDLRAAHELAGKTLRDGGQNRQAVFHFGMAWRICHSLEKHNNDCNNDCNDRSSSIVDEAEHEWRSVGDYAQICELSGFPEVGALALLFYRAGGMVDVDVDPALLTSLSTACGDESEYTNGSCNNGGTQQGCGCGMAKCGTSPCFVVFPVHSPIMNDILQALDAFSIYPNENFPTASDVLAHLANMTRKSNTIGDPVAAMHVFLSEEHKIREMPSILQFWDESEQLVSASANNQHKLLEQESECRALPPVILLLLLKLLYSSPISGRFLQLACFSVPYLAARFSPASQEGRMLAQRYKSHWAYYVFIRALVLGERVKKHRKGKVIHHVPVWDVIFGLETMSQEAEPKRDEEEVKEDRRILRDEDTISSYCRKILRVCSPKSISAVSKCDTLQYQGQNSSLSSFSAHPPIFVVGDSHVLSLAWQTLFIDTSKALMNNDDMENGPKQSPIYRTACPFPATGMKAWHVRSSTRFFTHYNLHACLQRLPPSSSRTVILSAGEIDCREGIGGTLLQGYYHNCSDAVERTVIEYLTSLTNLAEKYQLQLLVMPVAPHAYRSQKNGKSMGRARRRETMHLWNEILRRELGNGGRQKSPQPNNLPSKYDRIFLLDYEEKLHHSDTNSPVGYVLHPSYNADYTHVNSAIVALVEDAILHCGCDLALL